MPESCDVISFQGLPDDAGAVVDFEAKRSCPHSQEMKSKRDQPSRGAAFDLQLFFFLLGRVG